MQKAVDDTDLFRQKLQESQKDNTEMKLKIDVLTSTIDGLHSDIKHTKLELDATKESLAVYEAKSE